MHKKPPISYVQEMGGSSTSLGRVSDALSQLSTKEKQDDGVQAYSGRTCRPLRENRPFRAGSPGTHLPEAHGYGSGREALRKGPQGLKQINGWNIYQQLLRIRAGGVLSEQMETVITMLANEFYDLKPAEGIGHVDQECHAMWNLERN